MIQQFPYTVEGRNANQRDLSRLERQAQVNLRFRFNTAKCKVFALGPEKSLAYIQPGRSSP